MLAFALASSLAQGPSPPVDPSAPPVEQLCAAPTRSRASHRAAAAAGRA